MAFRKKSPRSVSSWKELALSAPGANSHQEVVQIAAFLMSQAAWIEMKSAGGGGSPRTAV
jgi:hypothetical protein